MKNWFVMMWGEEIADSSDLELLFKDATVLGDVE
jgi:hypothetical protein